MIIGLDVGGTHTDVVLLGNQGLVRQVKVPTRASDLFNTVLTGLGKVIEGIDPAAINRVVLSTTLTTNAIVEDNLPAVGMIVSSGPGIDPHHFKTHAHYVAVGGAIDHRGREVQPIDGDEILRIGRMFKDQGIGHVGVVGKFSVRNPAHEIRIRDLIADDVDKVFLGHQIAGGLNFPRRIATTYLNAAVYPIHRAFYEAVQQSLAAKGLQLPIRILKADGGNMKFESSVDFPGQTILSGPAASVMGAIAFASETEDTLVLDIGGTTTDMAILINRAPLLDPLGIEIGSYKTLIRSLDTHSIGIGGDSTVRVEGGQLLIGPRRKGPAMAYGGPVPTPTDALFVLGLMDDGDRNASIQGLSAVADALGIPLAEVASQVFEQASQKILDAAAAMVDRINSKPVYTIFELKEGYRIQPKEILVLGGPAPFFAEYLRQCSNYRVKVVPRWSVANAIGAALARTTCDVTLFADTEQKIAKAPEEHYSVSITKSFDTDAAIRTALDLLREKALARGANPQYLEMEVIENMQFNMVRGFNTTGRNIRVRVQVKPGLIHGYDSLIEKMSKGM